MKKIAIKVVPASNWYVSAVVLRPSHSVRRKWHWVRKGDTKAVCAVVPKDGWCFPDSDRRILVHVYVNEDNRCKHCDARMVKIE